jgi:peptide/nickel transport system permease protein
MVGTANVPLALGTEAHRGAVSRRARSIWLTVLGRLIRHPTGLIGVVCVSLVTLGAVLAPLIAPAGPIDQERGNELAGASLAHPFGTDELGRDILSRVLYGGRTSIAVGVIAVLCGAALGLILGLVAGYRSGAVEEITMRIVDVLLAFPAILMGIAVTAIVGTGARSVGVAVAIASIPDFARITRAATIAEKEREYVTAAHALGAPAVLIMRRHLFPNIIPPLLVQLSVAMAFSVLLESGLSFLGLGVQVPQPSWGSMLQSARTYLYQAPSYALFSGVALTMLLVGFNFVADALRDILDPRLNRRLR